MRKEEKGRDNRHGRHIKTRRGDTTRRAAQHGASRRAVGLHSGAVQCHSTPKMQVQNRETVIYVKNITKMSPK